MVAGICGCQSDESTFSDEIVIEEVIYSKIETVVSTPQDTINSSTENTSSTPQINSSTNTSNSTQPIEIDYNTIVEIDLCDDITRGYLNAKDAHNQYHWLSTYFGAYYDYQNLQLDWNLDLSSEYTVYFSEKSDFSNSIVLKTNATKQLNSATLIPGKTYYWKVVGNITDLPLDGGKIKINDMPVRWIYVDGIHNVRDMGGWKTENGKTVKYGMLYRGAQLNTDKNGQVVNLVTQKGLETFNSLGIKTEFDLRSIQNVHEKTTGTDLNYVLISTEEVAYSAYDSIAAKSQKALYIKMFEYLSNSNNYPIYAHCQGGADRTGTYAFLLNGLLGVSYDDLTKDFELTTFGGTKRWRSAGSGSSFTKGEEPLVDNGITIKWQALYDYMMDYGSKTNCTTLQQSIEHWFVNFVGVPKEQIDSFKAIMLE